MLEPYEVEWLKQAGAEEALVLPSEVVHQLYPEVMSYGPNGVQVVQLINAVKADIKKARKSDIMYSKAYVLIALQDLGLIHTTNYAASDKGMADEGFQKLYEIFGEQSELFEEEFDILGPTEKHYSTCVWWGFINAAIELSQHKGNRGNEPWIEAKNYPAYREILQVCGIKGKA